MGYDWEKRNRKLDGPDPDPPNQPSNRTILAQLLTLCVARHKQLVGMDTDGTAYRVRDDQTRIGNWNIAHRAVNALTWEVYRSGDTPTVIGHLLALSVPITGWHLVRRK